jgi:hypothetical protein
VVANLSGRSVSAKVSWQKNAGNYFDYATGKKVKISAMQNLTLPAWGYQVLTTSPIAK